MQANLWYLCCLCDRHISLFFIFVRLKNDNYKTIKWSKISAKDKNIELEALKCLFLFLKLKCLWPSCVVIRQHMVAMVIIGVVPQSVQKYSLWLLDPYLKPDKKGSGTQTSMEVSVLGRRSPTPPHSHPARLPLPGCRLPTLVQHFLCLYSQHFLSLSSSPDQQED